MSRELVCTLVATPAMLAGVILVGRLAWYIWRDRESRGDLLVVAMAGGAALLCAAVLAGLWWQALVVAP